MVWALEVVEARHGFAKRMGSNKIFFNKFVCRIFYFKNFSKSKKNIHLKYLLGIESPKMCFWTLPSYVIAHFKPCTGCPKKTDPFKKLITF